MGHEKLLILGTGGHGRVVADIAGRTHCYRAVAFLDDVPPPDTFAYPFLGGIARADRYIAEYDVFVAIGKSRIREAWMERLRDQGAALPSLVHPGAVVSGDAVMGAGTVVMPGAVINTGARLGAGVIVNTGSSIDHDCIIGDYCHIAVGAHLCGTVKVGGHTWIGAGATVIQALSICGSCMIGAGAVVIRDIPSPCTVVGCPARVLHATV